MKRKGFTLIELLAVIVILAIIVLIATPTILGVIEKARKGAFKDSVYGLIDATSIYMAENIEEGDLKFICDGTYCQLENGDKLSFKGEIPKSGAIKVDENQRISVEYISNGKYCAYGTMDNLVIDKDCEQLDTTEKANYTVNHYQMNVTGTGYTLKETETLSGSAGYPITPNTKSYVGFTSPTKQTVTVASDGSTVINYNYTRNQYTVTVNRGTGIASVSGTGTYYYGAAVNLGYSLTAGYHFSSWSGTYNTGSFTMPAGNVTITANGAGNVYYIAYNGNGATSGSMGTTTCTYGQNCTLAELGFAKTGYHLNNWNGSNGGSYSNGQTVSNLTTTNGATITMSANWAYNNGTAVYYNPVTNSKCNQGEAVSTTGTKTGCMKWYIFNDEGENISTVNMILDHNTTANVAYNSTDINTEPKEVADTLTTDTSTWNSNLNARLITADEVAKITGNTNFDSSKSTYKEWFYFDSNNQTKIATSQGASKYAWLFDYTTNCTSNGCNVADLGDYGPPFINGGYWTSTPESGSSSGVWSVSLSGGLYGGGAWLTIDGIRPVITVSKAIIQ